jgi:hypothetical protein
MRVYDPDDMDCCNYGCPPIYDEDIEKVFGVPTKDDIIKYYGLTVEDFEDEDEEAVIKRWTEQWYEDKAYEMSHDYGP